MTGRVWVVNTRGECQTMTMLLFTALIAYRLPFPKLGGR